MAFPIVDETISVFVSCIYMYAVVTLQIKTIFLFVFFFPFQRVPPVVDPVPVVIPPMPSAKQFSFLVGTRDGPFLPRKNDQNRREVVGQNQSLILFFSNRGNHSWKNITTLNNAQSSLSIGHARDTILCILYNPILRDILVDCR